MYIKVKEISVSVLHTFRHSATNAMINTFINLDHSRHLFILKEPRDLLTFNIGLKRVSDKFDT